MPLVQELARTPFALARVARENCRLAFLSPTLSVQCVSSALLGFEVCDLEHQSPTTELMRYGKAGLCLWREFRILQDRNGTLIPRPTSHELKGMSSANGPRVVRENVLATHMRQHFATKKLHALAGHLMGQRSCLAAG